MRFSKDIFISYAHIDDESLIEGEKGWISDFHRSLEVRLSQLLGYRPKIWRDSSLDGNHDFSNEIIDQFPDIAILISILSPRYVNSEWCTREVNEFCRISEQNAGLTINNKARVFKVIKTPVEIENHPKPIQGMLGYEFYIMIKKQKDLHSWYMMPSQNDHKIYIKHIQWSLSVHHPKAPESVNNEIASVIHSFPRTPDHYLGWGKKYCIPFDCFSDTYNSDIYIKHHPFRGFVYTLWDVCYKKSIEFPINIFHNFLFKSRLLWILQKKKNMK